MPNFTPPFLDLLAGFQLCVQHGSQGLGRNIAGADVDPGVFIDLAAEEAGAVGAFFAEDFGPFGVCGSLMTRAAAFAAGEVFGFVEGLGGEAAEGAQGAGSCRCRRGRGRCLRR